MYIAFSSIDENSLKNNLRKFLDLHKEYNNRINKYNLKISKTTKIVWNAIRIDMGVIGATIVLHFMIGDEALTKLMVSASIIILVTAFVYYAAVLLANSDKKQIEQTKQKLDAVNKIVTALGEAMQLMEKQQTLGNFIESHDDIVIDRNCIYTDDDLIEISVSGKSKDSVYNDKITVELPEEIVTQEYLDFTYINFTNTIYFLHERRSQIIF